MAMEAVRWTLVVAMLPLLLSCANPDPRIRVERWGELKAVVMRGEDRGLVSLADIAGRPDSYGIGALAGLAGEIIVLDGRVWYAQGNEAGDIVTSDRSGVNLQAAFLVLAEVPVWHERVLPEAIAWDDLEAEIGRAVNEAGLDASTPIPVRIEGDFADLRLHVLNGSCPYRSQDDGTPPFRFAPAAASGLLFGFYFEGEPGILTHRGQRLHLHALLSGDKPTAAHVDAASLKAGCLLGLP